ncbi:MAG: LamG-like jellyroll fold domain-containing protein [Bryobacteraceae bacterium]
MTDKHHPLLIALPAFLALSTTAAAQWSTPPAMPLTRYFHSAATGPDGQLYVIGGVIQGNPKPSGSVIRFDPATSQWSTAPAMNPRALHAAVTGCDGRIYVIGGYADPNTGTPGVTVQSYDPSSAAWQTEQQSLPNSIPVSPTTKSVVATSGADCRIYAADPSGDPVFSLDVFNKSAGWKQEPAIGNGEELFHMGAAHNGLLYAHGWSNYSFSSAWTDLSNTPYGATDYKGVSAPDNRVYVIGGLQPQAWRVDYPAITWGSTPQVATLRRDLAAAVADGRIYATGGRLAASPPSAVAESWGPVRAATGPYLARWRFNGSAGGTCASLKTTGTVAYPSGKVFNAVDLANGNLEAKGTLPCVNLDPSTGITIEFWINRGNLTGLQSILDKRSGNRGYHVFLYTSGGVTRVGIQLANGTQAVNQMSSIGLPANQWVHIAIVVQQALNGASIWMNAVRVHQFTPISGTFSNTAPLLIGAHSAGAQNRYKGLLDELTLYARPLNPVEIRSVFLAGSAGKI